MAEYVVKTPADKNGLRGVLGDAASTAFVPRLKLSKWDGEVEFGIEHDLVGVTGNKAFSVNGEVYTLDTNRLTLNFYPKTEGYEFELILKQKPGTNSISLPISHKNLIFLYQPPITAELRTGDTFIDGRTIGVVTDTWAYDIDGNPIRHRPENVVGSYAVYHATKRHDFSALGGYNYGCGKVCHIYRPLLTDALGATSWATLDINTTTGRLTITADQAFLDSATYPVIVDPTFGDSSYGAGDDWMTSGYVYGCSYACSESGVITSISAYVATQSGSGNIQLAVYTSASPPARLDYTDSAAITTTGGWSTINGTQSGSLSAANYWLCGNGSVGWKWWADAWTGGDANQQSGVTFGTWPTSLSSWGDYNPYLFSIYCTYSTGVTLTMSSAAFTEAADNVALNELRTLAMSAAAHELAATSPTLSVGGINYTLQITGEAKVS